ncbi:MAG: formylglycine-generating enzyme family protein [Sulfurovum sp.]|nr:formylglycine-generating enzyme family protein [Sulfurovum sp.]
MKELVAFISTHQKESDATQIAEVLWLSQFLNASKDVKVEDPKPSKQAVPQNKTSNLARDVSHKVSISSAQYEVEETHNHSLEQQENSNSFYASNIERKANFPNINEQFSLLKLKQKRVSTKEIDENKSADYIASTGIFNPIFREEKFYDAYFDLNIIIDTHESMFLWTEAITHFKKSLQFSKYLNKIHIFECDSSQNEIVFKNQKTGTKFTTETAIFKQKECFTLFFTDVTGSVWQNNKMFMLLNGWSKASFTAIVSMLPKHMWQRTALRDGESRFLKMGRFPPTNKNLHSEYAFIENSFAKDNLKIPIIPYDNHAFSYLCKVLTTSKGSLIETKIFEDLELIPIEKDKDKLDAKSRVKRFFNSASSKSRELAIYASILPLNKEIINEVIKVKSLGQDMDAFAEFYFGSLLDRERKVTLGEYDFYAGLRKALWQYISIDVAKELYLAIANILTNSLGIRANIVAFLFGKESNTRANFDEKEKALIDLVLEVLGDKGKFYRDEIQRIKDKSNTIYLKTNTYKMGSNDGDGDEKPVHKITFDYDFEIAKTPVTFEEYDLYCEKETIKKPSDRGWGRAKRPVINISWHDAVAYCAWLSHKTNETYRLPTEAEWEYACRAGTTTTWSFGDDETLLGDYAWYSKNSDNKTHEVGTKKLNPWGLHDMHGNVWEWCQDDWINSYEKTPKDGTAYEDKSSGSKVLRGGSWYPSSIRTRSADRINRNPSNSNFVGFRLLRTLP